MQTIATLAGVSRATVSRVLSTPEKVKPKTRETIENIMRECGYIYHAGAADLLKKRTHIIGLILPSVLSSVFASTILAVQKAANELGMSLLLGCSEFTPQKESDILHQFLARRVAGIIMIGYYWQNEAQILNLHKNGVPTVVIWDSPRNAKLCQIGFDNARAAAQATQYLIDMGHKRIAMISGPRNQAGRVEERISGFLETLRKNGLEDGDELVASCEPSIASGEQYALDMLSSPRRPTAIFAASDMMAIGALSAAKSLGLRVPADLSVVGFDNIDFSAHTNPPLTTVAVPEGEMSIMAARMIKQLINNEITPPISHCLETSFVIRESCAPPAVAASLPST